MATPVGFPIDLRAAAEGARGWPAQGEWTYDDYRRLPDDGWRYEVIRGRLYMTPAPKVRHQETVGRLFLAVSQWLEAGDVGKVYVAPVDVLLPGLATPVEPDLVFVHKDRLDIVGEDFIDGAPDLVIEVLSPSNWIVDRRDKYEVYALAGIGEYWIVDPKERTIEIFVLEDGSFVLLAKRGAGEAVASRLLTGLELEVDKVVPR